MKIHPGPGVSESRMELVHNGKSLFFNTSSFSRKSITAGHDIADHINRYWGKLAQYKQQKIFDLYGVILATMDAQFEPQYLIADLIPLVAKLQDEHKIEDVLQWINFHGNIDIPADFANEFVESIEKPTFREKTYTRPEYRELIAMAIALRAMVPIWGEFINRTEEATGNTHKEYRAYQLLADSKIMTSAPMEKLRVYVERNIKQEQPMNAAVLAGIGSQDYAQWLLSLILVRRVCIGDVSGNNQPSNLVKFIYNYVTQQGRDNGSSSFGHFVRDKEFESASGMTDNGTSRIEAYRITQDVPIGLIATLDFYLEDAHRVALKIKPNVNLQLLDTFLESAKVLQNERIWKPQVTIAQWILKPVMSPRALPQLSKARAITAIAITQTILWQNGHREIAALLSAITTTGMNLSGLDTRVQIPKEKKELLGKYYPYLKMTSSRLKTKPPNVAIAAIDELNKTFSERDWNLTIPDDFAAQITGNKAIRRYSCPADIKVLLATLAIEIAERRV